MNIPDIIFYGSLGAICGGRIGYLLLYDFNSFIYFPWNLLRIWQGGMSFHGGLVGVILSINIPSWKYNTNVFDILDFINMNF